MKLFKRILFLIVAIVLAFTVVGCGGTGDILNYDENGNLLLSGNTINLSGKAPRKSKKVRPVEYAGITIRGIDKDEMPIGGFFAPSDGYKGNGYKLPSLMTDEVYKKIADCGVNYLIDFQNDYSGTSFFDALEFGDKYGISTFVSYEDVMGLQDINNISVASAQDMATALQPLLQYERFAGLYGRDEPSANYYPHIKQAIANFRTAMDSIGDTAKDLSVYVNLFPEVGGIKLSGDQESPITYNEYLEGFFDCNPFYTMFDMYPIAGLENTVSSRWLDYLGLMNKSSKENGVAWQGFAQAGGNFFDVPGANRVTNKNELYYDVNTMLAFGAKGINYFPCVFPTSYVPLAPEDRINDNSLINKYGDTTAQYYYAQEINANVQAMAPYLLNSAHMGIILTGNGVCYYGGSDKMDSFRQLKSVSGDPSLVGCFDYKGGSAFVVVNNSLTEHRGEITLSFNKNYEYTVIQRATNNNIIAKNFTLTLEAGECALVVVK